MRYPFCSLIAAFTLAAANAAAEEFYREPEWKPRVTLPTADALNNFWPASPAPEGVNFDFPGLATERLGKIPPPGVHPRVYLTPDDAETIRARIKLGDKASPAFRNIWERVRKTRSPLYAYLVQDHELGRQLAADYMQRVRKIAVTIDAIGRFPDRDNIFAVEKSLVYAGDPAGQNSVFGLTSYDYLYQWLTEDERDEARRTIARAVKDRISNFMSVPDHFMINNHQCFGMAYLGLLLQIEGEEGFNPALYELAARKMQALLDYYLSPAGMCYETIKGWLPMSDFAPLFRRKPELLRHSRLHAKMRFYLSWMRSENGVWKNREEMRDSAFHVIWMMHYFFPKEPAYDFLYSATFTTNPILMNPEERWSGPVGANYENLLLTAQEVSGIDYTKPENIEKLKLPAFWEDPQRGYISVRNSWKPDDLYLNFAGKQDLVYGGHEGSEHGRWAMWADGVNWIYDNDMLFNKSGLLQNMISVDGKSVQWPPASSVWLGSGDNADASWAAVDYKDGYSFRKALRHPLNFPSLRGSYWEMFGRINLAYSRDQQLQYHPTSVAFYDGYAHTDYGLWNGEQRLLEDYREWNPMQKAFRTIVLAKGERPYVMMFDDLRKDGNKHQFVWNATLPDDVTLLQASNPEFTGMEPGKLNQNDLILGKSDTPRNLKRNRFWLPIYSPRRGDPQLLVRVFNRNADYGYPAPAVERSDRFTFLTIPALTVEPDYRVMLYPYRVGEPQPKTRWNDARTRFTVELDGRTDVWHFGHTDGGRTVFALERDGKIVQSSGAAPARPAVTVRGRRFDPADLRWTRRDGEIPVYPFADTIRVRMDRPVPPAVLRYTLDNSEPTENSPEFVSELILDRSAVLKARIFDPAWKCGPTASGITTVKLEKRTPEEAVAISETRPGIRARVYEINTKIWDDRGFFRAEKVMLPDLDRYQPLKDGITDGFLLPHVVPAAPMTEQSKGFYRFNGFFRASRDGAWRFSVTSCGPVSLTVGTQKAIREIGQFHQNWKERSGEVVLKAGWHPIELIVTDPIFWKINSDDPMPFHVSCSYEGGQEEPVAALCCKADSALPHLTSEPEIPAMAAETLSFRLEPGVERRSFDRPGKTDYGYVPHPDLLDVQESELRQSELCDELSGNDSNSSIVTYEGYFHAPVDGVYTFDTPARTDDKIDMNQLRINGIVIVQRGVPGRNPGRSVRLKAGYYPISLRLGESRSDLTVLYPDGRSETLTALRLFRPARPLVHPAGAAARDTYYEIYEPTSFELELPVSGTELRYTLDGSEPGAHSKQYDTPITVNALTVISAAGFQNGKRVTEITRCTVRPVKVPEAGQMLHLDFTNLNSDRRIPAVSDDGSASAWAAFDAVSTAEGLLVNNGPEGFRTERETNVDRSQDGVGLTIKGLKFDRSAMTVVLNAKLGKNSGKLFGKWGFNAIGKGYRTVRAELNNGRLRADATPSRVQGGNVPAGEWTLIVFTGDTERCTLYVDGKPVGSSDGSRDLATESLDVLIDVPATVRELRIYKRALSAEEVARLHEAATAEKQ